MRPWSTARRRVSGGAHAFVEVTSRRLEGGAGPSQQCVSDYGIAFQMLDDALGTAGHLQFVMYSLCDVGHHCERIARRRRTCRPIRCSAIELTTACERRQDLNSYGRAEWP